jgi:hypothetical protein
LAGRCDAPSLSGGGGKIGGPGFDCDAAVGLGTGDQSRVGTCKQKEAETKEDDHRTATSRGPDLAEMIWLAGGTFRMGSDKHYAEEAPAHRVTVDGFWIDRAPVTNRQFREFVRATGHVTFAEIAPDPKHYPGALPNMLRAGSLVFNPSKLPVDLTDWSQWWTFKFGADWRRPYGRAVRSMASMIIPSFTWPTAMLWHMRNGRARICRPKRSGSLPPAAGSTVPSSVLSRTRSRCSKGLLRAYQSPGRS